MNVTKYCLNQHDTAARVQIVPPQEKKMEFPLNEK